MILTTKGRYAVMAMIALGERQGAYATRIVEISEMKNIPHSYLEQIFSLLRNAGIVESVRGPGGGYRLKTPPESLRLINIINAVDERITMTKCHNNSESFCIAPSVQCRAHDLWVGLEYKILNYFSNITVQDVVDGNFRNIISSNRNIVGRSQNHIYFDHNATTDIDPRVKEFIDLIPSVPLNPSSIHWHGRLARSMLEDARNNIAYAMGIKLGPGDDYSITFTSSGTESNNLVLNNFKEKHVLISSVEHMSILEPAKKNPNTQVIPVDSDGQIDMQELERKLQTIPEGSLLSVMMANNETGILQKNISEIAALARRYKIFIHSDCVQALGKIHINYNEFDFVTISSHKVGGISGVGALIHRSNIAIQAQIVGGGQERGMRSGTENVIGISGFGIAATFLDSRCNKLLDVAILRDKMEAMIKDICPDVMIFGENAARLNNTSSIMMPGVDSQKQIMKFDLAGISVSAGSACSSGKTKISHVLKAMGATDEEASCTIRISLGLEVLEEEIIQFVDSWKIIFEEARNGTN